MSLCLLGREAGSTRDAACLVVTWCAWPWQVTGIVMMCIGGLFLCPIAFMCCSWLAQKRSRHSEYLKNDSIFVPKQYDRCALAHTDR